MARIKKPFEATNFQGFLILSGETPPDLWTSAVFGSREEARQYIEHRRTLYAWDLSKHSIVPCQAAVRVINYEPV